MPSEQTGPSEPQAVARRALPIWVTFAATLTGAVCLALVAWYGVLFFVFGMVGFYQRLMTLESAGSSAIPLKLLECVPLLIPGVLALVLTRRRKRALAIYMACLGVFLACLPLFGRSELFNRLENPYNDRRFDAAVWQAQAGSSESLNPRGQMIRDLLANHLRVGMPHSEVLSLLGPAEDANEQTGSLRYILGLYSGIFDHEFLILRFQDGKLASASVEES